MTCLGCSCFGHEVDTWEAGLGVPLGKAGAALQGWLAGIAVGHATQKFGESGAVFGAYVTRSWQLTNYILIRTEGRLRSMRAGNLRSRGGAGLKAGIGLYAP